MSANYDLDDYHWLVGSAEAAGQLRRVEQSGLPLHRLAAALRRNLSAARTHLVLEQVSLRRRAADKFARPERMFFRPAALEQATDQWVARYKAARFPAGRVVDLCCGVGGDLIELAAGRAALGVDRDPVAALLAEANCRALGRTARLVVAQATAEPLGAAEAWHVDPDRRASGRRRRNLEDASPPLAQVRAWLEDHPTAAVKLSPASDVPDGWSDRAELEWISRAGHCRQQIAWFGQLAPCAGRRRATLLGNDGRPICSVVGLPGEQLPRTHRVGTYLYEPDPAVLAADLAGTLAGQLGLAAALPGGVFFTDAKAVDHRAVARFAVIEAMPYHARRVREMLQRRGIDGLEIKLRGVDTTASRVRAQLRLHGPPEATLLVLRIDRSVLAILARRAAAACRLGNTSAV